MGKFELEVKVRTDGNAQVVSLSGPVDSATQDLFREQLSPVCAVPGARVVLDCTELTYLNSRSIGLLMRYNRDLQMSRGRLVLCNLNQKLVRTLELLQIGKSLVIYPTLAEALASLR